MSSATMVFTAALPLSLAGEGMASSQSDPARTAVVGKRSSVSVIINFQIIVRKILLVSPPSNQIKEEKN